MEYEHKGVKIKLDAINGTFAAPLEGRVRRFPSVDAARKAIDKAALVAFEPFAVIREPSYEDKKADRSRPFVEDRVIGIERAKGKKSWSNRDYFILASGRRNVRDVMPDTPENRAAFTAYIQYSLESARIESEREEGLDRLRKAIVKREAD